MHVHFLGICGTFMAGLALIARELGHRVTGSDRNVYPPMSGVLARAGIEPIAGYDPAQLDPAPDVVVVGNSMTRGNPCVEHILDTGLPHASGPAWLSANVLAGRHVVAVAGTHGKTTTTAMIAVILEAAGLEPGFLVGGVPRDLDTVARVGGVPRDLDAGGRGGGVPRDLDTVARAGGVPRDLDAGGRGGGVSRDLDAVGRGSPRPPFVIEADEYDTAFFDKRSKFLHYRPRTLVLNNLEFDHADIFRDLADMQRQFHHVVRIVPAGGRIVAGAGQRHIEEVLAMGCWTPVERVGDGGDWSAVMATPDGGRFEVRHRGRTVAEVEWEQRGAHNVANALAAIAAARHAGVEPATAARALGGFTGVRRRLEHCATVDGIALYDDFAHHPTAVEAAIDALRGSRGSQAGEGRRRASRASEAGEGRLPASRASEADEGRLPASRASEAGEGRLPASRASEAGEGRLPASRASEAGEGRLLAVLELASNTMRRGTHRATLGPALSGADAAWVLAPPPGSGLGGWDAHSLARGDGAVRVRDDVDTIVRECCEAARPGDAILMMSNAGFGGIQDRLAAALRARAAARDDGSAGA